MKHLQWGNPAPGPQGCVVWAPLCVHINITWEACYNADSGPRSLEWTLEVLHFCELPGDALKPHLEKLDSKGSALSQTKLDSLLRNIGGVHRLCEAALCLPPPGLYLSMKPRQCWPILASALGCLMSSLPVEDVKIQVWDSGKEKSPFIFYLGYEVWSRPHSRELRTRILGRSFIWSLQRSPFMICLFGSFTNFSVGVFVF